MAGKGQIEPRWNKGESGNPAGRPKGSKNRSTIARHWLEVNQSLKNPLTGEQEIMSQEDLMTLALIKKAREGDVNAYKALMDSGNYDKSSIVALLQKYIPDFQHIETGKTLDQKM